MGAAVLSLTVASCQKKTVESTVGDDASTELRAPRIEVDDRGLFVNGKALVEAAALPSKDALYIRPLFALLEENRARWRTAHPGDEFDGVLELRIAPEVNAVTGVSVLYTAGTAGIHRVHLRSGAVTWEGRLWWQRPVEDSNEIHPNDDVRISPRANKPGSGWHLSFEGGRLCRTATRVREASRVAEVGDAIVDGCGALAACPSHVIITPPTDGPFLDVANLLVAAFRPPSIARAAPEVAFDVPGHFGLGEPESVVGQPYPHPCPAIADAGREGGRP